MAGKRWIAFAAFILLLSTAARAGPPEVAASSADLEWGIGVSAISPGLPVALKGVWQRNGWGVQAECNYFYMLGMIRIDGRRVLRNWAGTKIYGFAGITGMHFNDGLGASDSIDNTLMADLGIGWELRLGRKRNFSIGAEGGLLIPFASSLGFEQYDNSGLLVANAYALFWF